MLSLPTLPAWPHMHPILVHLPIGVLMLAPLFVLIGIAPVRTTGIRCAALILLVCGTLGCFLAIRSGEAASEANEVGMIDGADKVVSDHEELAERAFFIFVSLTIVYGGGLLTQHFWKTAQRTAPHVIFHTIVLIGTLLGALTLANVGHLGGRLVHQYNVRATITP